MWLAIIIIIRNSPCPSGTSAFKSQLARDYSLWGSSNPDYSLWGSSNPDYSLWGLEPRLQPVGGSKPRTQATACGGLEPRLQPVGGSNPDYSLWGARTQTTACRGLEHALPGGRSFTMVDSAEQLLGDANVLFNHDLLYIKLIM
ncbi:hypothetical protein RRG08_054503 [Elysia crispata]|uniref:Uncharacterized protein n=1 Tax=Elysia crispata TaxID=231223 RepID=A0AAE0YVJ2_9GAST|nr:hypothetical protein RRG08_054503 [Elysia crispata]